MIGWKTSNPGLPLNGKASSPAKMPTFSARLPKSHFPGPNIGIVFGLFYLHNNELSARVRLTFMLASTLNSLSNSGGFMSDRPIEADELEEDTKVKPDEHEKDDESLAPESGDKQPD